MGHQTPQDAIGGDAAPWVLSDTADGHGGTPGSTWVESEVVVPASGVVTVYADPGDRVLVRISSDPPTRE